MEDISTKAYAQWVIFDFTNSSPKTLVVENVNLMWGKFHEDGDKDWEIPVNKIANTKIRPGSEFRFSSCGRSDSPSGTEGEFDVYEEDGELVAHFYWSYPWGGSANIWKITQRNAKWVVKSTGGNLKSGALGPIQVELSKRGV